MKDDKRLKRKVRNSYLVSTVSIALVLFLLGSVGYLMVAALKVADTLQESIAVSVELRREATDEEKTALKAWFEQEELVATISYLPKEEKIEDSEFRKMFGSSFEEVLEENPLLDSFELTSPRPRPTRSCSTASSPPSNASTGSIASPTPALMAERLPCHGGQDPPRAAALRRGAAPRVAHPGKQHDPAGHLLETLSDQHDEARRGDQVVHHAPFLGSSLRQGVLAGVIASVLFGVAVYGVNEAVPELLTIAEAGKIALIIGAMLAGGIVISGVFSLAALNKFINMKSNKIYLY